MRQLIRYPDLVAAGIVSNRTQLGRMIANQGFPSSIRLGPNTVAWDEEEVRLWVEARAAERMIEDAAA